MRYLSLQDLCQELKQQHSLHHFSSPRESRDHPLQRETEEEEKRRERETDRQRERERETERERERDRERERKERGDTSSFIFHLLSQIILLPGPPPPLVVTADIFQANLSDCKKKLPENQPTEN